MNLDAFGAAYLQHRPRLLALANRLTKEQEAEDLLQDVVVRLMAEGHVEAMPEGDECLAYFCTALFSLAMNYWVRSAREAEIFVPAGALTLPDESGADPIQRLASAAPGPEQDAVWRGFYRAFRGVKMTPRQWEAVEGYYLEGASQPKLARRAGVSVRQVKRLLAEARTILRDALDEWAPTSRVNVR